MANNTITFNPDSNTAYGVNLTIYEGADFKSTFQVKNENKSAFDLTGYTVVGRLKKSVSIGASSGGITSFTSGITSAAAGQFSLSLTDTVTASLNPGRYFFDINAVSSASTVFKMVTGNVLVEGGLSIP
tara:strand:+ start:19 stop:405 length:387 start_codon:yes stop_codon:yes gene_type:complete